MRLFNHMLIRAAALHDLNNLVDLENECFTADKMQRKHYRALLTKPSAKIFLAEDDHKVVGCLVVLFRKNTSRARIYSLAVSPAYRHLGIAKKLCAAIEDEAKWRNCASILLEVRPDNHAAISFYQKNGYEIFGSYTKFYEDGTDAWRMKKIL